MVIGNFMKRFLFILSFSLYAISAPAQQTDSVKYKNGFLYYHEFGKGDPIVLLAGGPGNNCSQLAGMASALSSKNRVILLEERGTGRSIPDPFDSTTINLETEVSDIRLLLDHLGLRQAIICGHSWGATLALYFAIGAPDQVKSLIMISPSALLVGEDLRRTLAYNRNTRLNPGEKKRLAILGQKILSTGLTLNESMEYSYLLTSGFIANKDRMDSLLPLIDAPRNDKTMQLIFNDVNKSKTDLRSSLILLKKPVYVIEGRQDILNYVGYEFKILAPSFELYWIQNCGHYPMFEQPETFYQILFQILSGQQLGTTGSP